jgi:hypothetical protein
VCVCVCGGGGGGLVGGVGVRVGYVSLSLRIYTYTYLVVARTRDSPCSGQETHFRRKRDLFQEEKRPVSGGRRPNI